MINKINGLLGISAKAGKIVSGTDSVLGEISKKNLKLVIVAEDTSDKTIKNIKYYANKQNIEMIIFGTIDSNSKAIGKQNKAVIGLKDKNLAEAILKVFHGGEVNGKD